VSPAVAQQKVQLLDDGGSNQVKIKLLNSNKCAQAQADNTVIQATCVTGAVNQRWTFAETPGGWRITTALNAGCLNSNPSGGDGTALAVAGCSPTPAPSELWAITDVADASIVDPDAEQPDLPTVTYTRDATDRIVARAATGETTVRYGHTGAGEPHKS
jgi:hypothetical protein